MLHLPVVVSVLIGRSRWFLIQHAPVTEDSHEAVSVETPWAIPMLPWKNRIQPRTVSLQNKFHFESPLWSLMASLHVLDSILAGASYILSKPCVWPWEIKLTKCFFLTGCISCICMRGPACVGAACLTVKWCAIKLLVSSLRWHVSTGADRNCCFFAGETASLERSEWKHLLRGMTAWLRRWRQGTIVKD